MRALAAAGPGAPGRPAHEPDASAEREAGLEQKVQELKQELVMAEVRTEIALVKPDLLERAVVKAIKKRPGSARRAGSRARGRSAR